MAFAVGLFFDPKTEETIQFVLEQAVKNDIKSSLATKGFRPHISLGVCNSLQPDIFGKALYDFAAGVSPFSLMLSNLGIFLGSEGVIKSAGVIFLGVTATKHLLDLHSSFHQFFENHLHEPWEYYSAGKWVPHCTLATGLIKSEIAKTVAAYQNISLPIKAQVREIGLIEISPLSCHTLCAFDLDN